MRSKEVRNAIEEIKHLKSFGTSGIVPRWSTIDILLTYIEKLEKEEDRDYTTIYLKGCTDKDGYWRDKMRDKIKEWDKSIKWANSDDHYYAIKILKDLLEGE